jgi:hypothetical protein
MLSAESDALGVAGWDHTLAGLPAEHQQRAERVRAHLVVLRGGAPFLSPTDAAALLEWLDRDVPVPLLLAALEDAAERRRRLRSRSPLSLQNARGEVRRRLQRPQADGRPTGSRAAWVTEVGAMPDLPVASDAPGPLDAIIAPLRTAPEASELVAALSALHAPDADALADAAIELASRWLLQRWDALPEAERTEMLHNALAELLTWGADLPEATQVELCEEAARAVLRERYPTLSATFILRWVC